jgi:Uma2 family endonuclease
MLSVEEYLRTSYEPNCDYIDGVLRPKPWPWFNHASTQLRICTLISKRFPDFAAVPELTVILTETKCFVPDVAAQHCSDLQAPFPVRPIHLCAEILSPGENPEDLFAKCGEYHAWGVPYCWIVDPDAKRCWQYDRNTRPTEIPTAGALAAGPIILNHADLFASL